MGKIDMKNYFKVSALSLLLAFGGATPAFAQMTAQGCKDAGGTWTQTFGVYGKCIIAIKARDGTKPEKNITAEKCKELGGQMQSDNSCLIITKNMAKPTSPSNSS